MSQTPLSRMLNQETRPDALTAFKAARSAFVAGRRIEMQELASELGVSRATLFRWVGGKDQLLAEIVWSVAEPTLARADEAATGLTGGQRITAITTNYAAAVIESPFFFSFVQREPERAMRLLTTRATSFQGRAMDWFEALISDEVDAGHLIPPLPVRDLAYVLVRLAETFIYADAIAGETPDPEKVRLTVGALLRD